MTLSQLQEQFIGELLDSVPHAWKRIEVHYERYTWDGETSEIYVANSFVGNDRTDVDLTLEAIDGLLEMQKQVPSGQTEPWTWLEFSLDDTGRYSFDFKYGVPPMTKASLHRQNG